MAPLKRAWIRFLRETGKATTNETQAVLLSEVASQAPEIRNALELSGEAGFSLGELEAYDRYWDAISSERTLISGKYAEGRAEGRAEGKAEGKAEAERALIAKLIAEGMDEAAARRLVLG